MHCSDSIVPERSDPSSIALGVLSTFARARGGCVRLTQDGDLWFVTVDQLMGVGSSVVEACERCLSLAHDVVMRRAHFADDNARARDHVVFTAVPLVVSSGNRKRRACSYPPSEGGQ